MTTYTEQHSSTKSMSSFSQENKGMPTKYHSTITPRTTLNTQSALMSQSSPSRSHSSFKSEYSHGVANESLITQSTNTEVEVVKNTRKNEKKEMRDLNERLATYIEKVRFLEAQNRKMAAELDDLRCKWGKETATIRNMYETELREARKLLDDQAKDKSGVDIRVKTLEEQNRDLLAKIDEFKQYREIDGEQLKKLNTQLADYDGEISLLRRNLESIEKERDRDKKTIAKLNDDLEKLRTALNCMTLAQLDAENRRQTLQEELEFTKCRHEEEMKELASLAYRDTTEENRQYWKSELSQAIKDIQNEFDIKNESIRTDLETYYNMKVQEFKTNFTKQNMETTHAREEAKKLKQQHNDLRGKVADLESRNVQLDMLYKKLLEDYDERDREHGIENGKLKDEINTLRCEMERIYCELQTLMDAKLSLELEISAYRKLLEVEENRVGLRCAVENMISSQAVQQQTQSSVKQQSQYSVQQQSQYAAQQSDVVNNSYRSPNKSGDSQMSMKMMRGEVSARTTSQRTVKGPIAISDISSEGKYITLENKGTSNSVTDVVMDGWKIVRQLDSKRDVCYTFGKYTIPASKSITIYAKGASKLATLKDLIMDSEDSWGVASHVVTTLYNEKGEQRASTIQNTIYG